MNNIDDFDSREEWFFNLWSNELLPSGLIKKLTYHPHPFILTDKVTLTYEEQLVTKTKIKDFHLMADHKYQADWIIYWDEKALGILFDHRNHSKDLPFFVKWSNKHESFFSVIDVKGSFSGPHNNSAITFPLNQKWVYQKHGIYVQKIIQIPRVTKKGKQIPCDSLFTTTFLPRRLLTTDNSGTDRKINFKYILVEEFLKNHGLR